MKYFVDLKALVRVKSWPGGWQVAVLTKFVGILSRTGGWSIGKTQGVVGDFPS